MLKISAPAAQSAGVFVTMDMKLKVLDLFSGLGGVSLGLERTGRFMTVAFCENDPMCRKVINSHWPGMMIHEDIATLDGALYENKVNLIAGGFPCQDISVAGTGRGLSGERSGLWKEMLRVISEAKPDWVLVENVRAIRTRGADQILDELGELGYSCWPLCLGACHAGASHQRARYWIIGLLGHPCCAGCKERHAAEIARYSGHVAGVFAPTFPAGTEAPQFAFEQPRTITAEDFKRPMGASNDGVSVRLVRLPTPTTVTGNLATIKMAGNAVVPQIVTALGNAIWRIERVLDRGRVPCNF